MSAPVSKITVPCRHLYLQFTYPKFSLKFNYLIIKNYSLKSLAGTTDEAPTHRGKFTMKLVKLKFQGPSLVQAPSKALKGALLKYSLACLFLILYSFS